MPRHTHRFNIADDDAVQVLLTKLLGAGMPPGAARKLLKDLDEASVRYRESAQKVRQAFFSRAADRIRPDV